MEPGCVFGCFRNPRVTVFGLVLFLGILTVTDGQFGRFPGYPSDRYRSFRQLRQNGFPASGRRQYPMALAQSRFSGTAPAQNRFRASQAQTINRGVSRNPRFRAEPVPTGSPGVVTQSIYQGADRQTGIQSQAEVIQRQRHHLQRKMEQRRHLERKIARQTALLRQNSVAQFNPRTNGVDRRHTGSTVTGQQTAARQQSRGNVNQNRFSQRTNNLQVQRRQNSQIYQSHQIAPSQNNFNNINTVNLQSRTDAVNRIHRNNIRVPAAASNQVPESRANFLNLRNVSMANRLTSVQRHRPMLSTTFQLPSRVSLPRLKPKTQGVNTNTNVRTIRKTATANVATPPRRNIILLVRRPAKPKTRVLMPIPSIVPPATREARVHVATRTKQIPQLAINGQPALPAVAIIGNTAPVLNTNMNSQPNVAPFMDQLFNPFAPVVANDPLFPGPLFPGSIVPYNPMAAILGSTGVNGLPIHLQRRMGSTHPSMLSPALQQMFFGDTQDPPDNNTEVEDGVTTTTATKATTTTTKPPTTVKPEIVNLQSLVDRMLVILGNTDQTNPTNAASNAGAAAGVGIGVGQAAIVPPAGSVADQIIVTKTQNTINSVVGTKIETTGNLVADAIVNTNTDKVININANDQKAQISANAEYRNNVNDVNTYQGGVGKEKVSKTVKVDVPANSVYSNPAIVQPEAYPAAGTIADPAALGVVVSAAIHTPSVQVTKIDKATPLSGHIAKLAEVSPTNSWKIKDNPGGVGIHLVSSKDGGIIQTGDATPSLRVDQIKYSQGGKMADRSAPIPRPPAPSEGPAPIPPPPPALPNGNAPASAPPAPTVNDNGRVASMAAVFAEVLSNVRRLWGPAPPVASPNKAATADKPTTTTAETTTASGGEYEPIELEDMVTTTTTEPTTTTIVTTTTTPTTTTATAAKCNMSSPNFKCRGKHPFNTMAAMGPWCHKMCNLGQCSLSVCECTCDSVPGGAPPIPTTKRPTAVDITAPLLSEATAFHKKSAIKSHKKSIPNMKHSIKPQNPKTKTKNVAENINKIKKNNNNKNNNKNNGVKNNNNNKKKNNNRNNRNNQNARRKPNRQPNRKSNRKPKPRRTTTTTTQAIPTTEEPPEVEEIEWEDIVTTTSIMTTTDLPPEFTTNYENYTTNTMWPFFGDLPLLEEIQGDFKFSDLPTPSPDLMWGTEMKAQQGTQNIQGSDVTMATPAAMYTTSVNFDTTTANLPKAPPASWTDIGIKDPPPERGLMSRKISPKWRVFTPDQTSNATRGRPSDRPSDQPSGHSQSRPSDRPVDRPSGRHSDRPIDSSKTRPSDRLSDRIRASPIDRPSDRIRASPSDRLSDVSSGSPSDIPRTRPKWRDTNSNPSQWHEPIVKPFVWQDQTRGPPRWQEPTPEPRRWRDTTTPDPPRWRDATLDPPRRWRDTTPRPSGRMLRRRDRWADRGSNRAPDRPWRDRRPAERRPADRWRERTPTTESYWRDQPPADRNPPRDRWNREPAWRSGSRDTWRTGSQATAGRRRDRWRDQPYHDYRLRDSWRMRDSGSRRYAGSLRDRWRQTTTPAGEEQEPPEAGDK